MKITTIYLLTFLLFISCSGNKKNSDKYTEAKELYKQSLDIHDEIMPKMGEIMQLQQKLKDKKDSISDQDKVSKIETSIQDLENINADMMQWMHNIPKVPEQDASQASETGELPSPKEAKTIQENSLKKIREVRKNMDESIGRANELLESLNSR